jgi:hypothetical protein
MIRRRRRRRKKKARAFRSEEDNIMGRGMSGYM